MSSDEQKSQPSNPPAEPTSSNPPITPFVAKPAGTASGMTTLVNSQQITKTNKK